MTRKLAFSTFLTCFLPAAIKNADESSTLSKWPWFTHNNNERNENGYCLTYPTGREKVCLIIYFKSGKERGRLSLPSTISPCSFSRQHCGPLQCGICYEVFLKEGVVAQEQHYVQEEEGRYPAVLAFGMTARGH